MEKVFQNTLKHEAYVLWLVKCLPIHPNRITAFYGFCFCPQVSAFFQSGAPISNHVVPRIGDGEFSSSEEDYEQSMLPQPRASAARDEDSDSEEEVRVGGGIGVAARIAAVTQIDSIIMDDNFLNHFFIDELAAVLEIVCFP